MCIFALHTKHDGSEAQQVLNLSVAACIKLGLSPQLADSTITASNVRLRNDTRPGKHIANTHMTCLSAAHVALDSTGRRAGCNVVPACRSAQHTCTISGAHVTVLLSGKLD